MSRHLKRLAVPKTWHVSRKTNTWITKSSPGPHKIENSVPLTVALRDLLEYAENDREVRNVLNARKIMVNGKIETDRAFPLGFMDILEIPSSKEIFLVTLTKKGRLMLKSIKKADHRLCRLEGKTVLKGGKIQLNLWGGANIIVEKDEYKVGDTIKLALKDKKIKGKIELKEGNSAFIIGGNYIGEQVKIKKIELSGEIKEAILLDVNEVIFNFLSYP